MATKLFQFTSHKEPYAILAGLDGAFCMDPELFWCTKYTHMWIFGIFICFSISFFKQNNY